MFPTTIRRVAVDAACCALSRFTGVPIARRYSTSATVQLGRLLLVAVPLVDVPAFLATHPRAVAADSVTGHLTDPANPAAFAVGGHLARLRAAHPWCHVYVLPADPAGEHPQ